nr:S8 family serine peptidase [Candidatus Krumholzibacteria bacterium]
MRPLPAFPATSAQQLKKAPHTRTTFSQAGDPHRQDHPFQEKDLTLELGLETGPVQNLTPEEQALVAALGDPTYLRQLRTSTRMAGQRLPMLGGPRDEAPAGRDLPWSANQLLANPTNMNDEYVSLAQNPLTGNLYAVFAARDLGGTDRDIHIAVSEDGGLTWTVQEMPSSSIDEYHPEIAVDGGGYIHVVWVRDDGWILRARTAQPGDITDWAWVKGLGTEETMATPSIAVSGAGDFARVFIAAGWLTINWDLYQYEWTLIFMASSNGGQTVTYDYFLPDGYQDLWPDVGMNAGTVHFVNAEVDYYTGETEILLATDAFTGSFGDPGLITGYTPNSCGFPQLACQGDNVYVVYQEDFTDGLTVDGDITYTYSWDAGGTFFGPIGLVADPYESVGPSVFVKDGVVGVLWLDGPPGADEFQLAARLGAGSGHSDFFGNVEIVTEQPRVEPMFHSCFGVATGDRICAAWIDRRDFPTQGHNVYTSRQLVAPNLSAFTPSGWSDALVGNIVRTSRTSGFLASEDTTYISFALANTGLADFTQPFALDLRLDDTLLGSWTLTGGMATGSYFPVEELPVFVEEEGTYTITATLDLLDSVPESNESDNVISRTWTWVPGAAEMRFSRPHITKSIIPEMPRSEAWRLVDQPLLRQETHLPVIAPELATAMAGVTAEERLRVMIVPAERLDPVAMGQALQGAAKMTRREVITEAAKRQIVKSRTAVATRLGLDRAVDWKPLWLAGTIAARLNREDILELAGDPQVGLLYLDNTKSQTFGTKSNTESRATAWHLTEIGAEMAWAQGLTGEGIVVGHLDSGVAYDHPDLSAAMWDGGSAFPHHGWDTVDEDDDPYDGDTDWGHGTHTAGLIVGNGASGTTTGAAPGATLMALRAVPGYLDDLIEAMQFGLDNGVHLFSLSGGWGQAGADIRAANRYNAELLLSIDVPWICAAGNGDNYGGHHAVPTDIASPGDCPSPWYAPSGGATGVITVGATVQGGSVWEGSSFGPTSWDIDNTYGDTDYHDYPYTPGLMKPDLAAPGANVTSTSNHGGYITYSGTSMATPLITGVVCLLWSGSPQLLVPQVCELLETTATDLVASPASPGRDNYTGAGLVDLATALGQIPTATAELFWICNDGDLPLVIEDISWTDPWLDVVLPTMVIAPDDSIQAAAFIDPTLTVEGYHNANVAFRSNEHRPGRILPITLIYGDQYSATPDQLPTASVARLTNHPNPFNPRTVVHFANPREGRVQLCLYDLKGRLVRTLVDGPTPAGEQGALWDGQDDGGRPLPSGTYLARARLADGQIVQGKLMLVR